nr:hypothetical protein [Microvirga makkahensis]
MDPQIILDVPHAAYALDKILGIPLHDPASDVACKRHPTIHGSDIDIGRADMRAFGQALTVMLDDPCVGASVPLRATAAVRASVGIGSGAAMSIVLVPVSNLGRIIYLLCTCPRTSSCAHHDITSSFQMHASFAGVAISA